MNYPRQQSQLYRNNDGKKPWPVLTILLSLVCQFFLFMPVGLTGWTGFSSELTLSQELSTTISKLYRNSDGNKSSPLLTILLSLALSLSHDDYPLIITYTAQLGFFWAISLATTARIRSHWVHTEHVLVTWAVERTLVNICITRKKKC